MHTKDYYRLESILEAIQKIESYTREFHDADQLNDSNLAFDATMMNFVVIGEMVAKLSEDFKSQHPEIEWGKMKGLRNIAAHNYFGIDAEEVWQIINHNIPALKCFIEKQL